MKKIGIVLMIVIGIGSLVFGRLHWNNRIQTAVSGEEVRNTETVQAKEVVSPSYMSYTKHLPEAVVNKLAEAKQNNETVNLTLIAGTEPSWVTGFENELVNAYGEGVWDIQTITYGEQTSVQLLQGDFLEQVKNTNPDVILYEAPLLNDNGQVGSAGSIEANQQILEQWVAWNPNIAILIQPSHPIYQGVFYPQEVANFKAFAEEHNYTYIDHWEAWPDKDSEEMLTYFNTDRTEVNEMGYRLWVDYLISYFVSR